MRRLIIEVSEEDLTPYQEENLRDIIDSALCDALDMDSDIGFNVEEETYKKDLVLWYE